MKERLTLTFATAAASILFSILANTASEPSRFLTETLKGRIVTARATGRAKFISLRLKIKEEKIFHSLLTKGSKSQHGIFS